MYISFLAYYLYVTLGRQLKSLAAGLTSRSALERFAAVQMIDVRIPTTDGRELLLTIEDHLTKYEAESRPWRELLHNLHAGVRRRACARLAISECRAVLEI